MISLIFLVYPQLSETKRCHLQCKVIARKWCQVRNPRLSSRFLFNCSPHNWMFIYSSVLQLRMCKAYFIWSSWRFVMNVVSSTCGSMPVSQMFQRGKGSIDESKQGRWRNDELPDQLHDAEVWQQGKGWTEWSRLRLITLHSSQTKFHLQLEMLEAVQLQAKESCCFLTVTVYSFIIII